MNAKKLFGILLAGAMALSTVAGLAACGGNKKPDDPDDPNPPVVDPDDPDDPTDPTEPGKNDDWTGTVYTLVGTGSSETLWTCNWDQTLVREDLTFKAGYDTDGVTEIHTLTIDLYEGDEFQVIHDHAWAGQMGFTSVTAESQQYLASAPGGGDMPNISVAKGKSGLYELTVTVPASGSATIKAELKEPFPELVTLKLLNLDGSTIQPSNYTQSMRDIGRYYKKGATIPAMPYRPGDELPDPYMMTFDGWSKEDGSKWEGGTINAATTLKIRYIEEANEGFIADKEDAEYWLTKDTETKFVHDAAYSQHNVYTLNNVELHTGDKVQIGWGTDKVSKYDWIINPDIMFTKDGEQATVLQDGLYFIRIVVTVNASKEVTEMAISVERLGALLSGYYLVGTYKGHTDSWWDNPDQAIFLTQDAKDENVWTCTITITEADFVPKGWDDNKDGSVKKAALKVKLYQVDGKGADYGVGAESGTAGSGNILLGAGTWEITFNSSTHTVTYTQK